MKDKIITIFALVKDNILYIGKSNGKRISAVYSRHRNGKHVSTHKHFAKPAPPPDLHILFRQPMQDFEAYKYVLSYIRLFREAGYQILNCPRSIERSYELKENTLEIFESIKTNNIPKLLQTTRITKITDADIKADRIIEKDTPNADCMLTIRLTKNERDRFRQIGATLNLNQHQTLLYLFDKCAQPDPFFIDLGGDSYLRILFDCQREEIEKLNTKNSALTKKLISYRDDNNKKLSSAREAFTDIKASISSYFAMMESTAPTPLEIEYGLYKNATDIKKYKYPENSGIFLIRPQMVLRGKGRYSAQFILGFDINTNRYLKFRFYPKQTYVGVPIPDSRFSTRGSMWLVGCKNANDGAMQLYCSLPMDIRQKNI